ncbi:uroporphyrinogen decarboxylase [Demequina sp.]|uniref:uroporphyrinogen decarboxylase n=1 Tax=Demequina sp. TaxID=2050685 RepID=UPI003D0AB1FD
MPQSQLIDGHPLLTGAVADSPLLAAYRGDVPSRRPVWFMRQAGRSLPEYRETRAGTDMLDACLTPELAAEITLQPVRRYGVDAAIFFSDIVVPLKLAGLEVSIQPGIGPVFARPIRTMADVEALPELDEDFIRALTPVAQAVALTTAQLGGTPLIGFAGAPFTLAAYMVEGKASRDHLGARRLMAEAPDVWAGLAAWVAEVSGWFLRTQVLAGASAVQLFDSWAGSLSTADYEKFCQAASARVFELVSDLPVPRVHFAANGAHLLAPMAATGATVMGVDYRLPLDEAVLEVGHLPLQGNINPAYLTAPWETLREHVDDVLMRGAHASGHVVNLGHGVPPDTDPDVLQRIVDHVHDAPVA